MKCHASIFSFIKFCGNGGCSAQIFHGRIGLGKNKLESQHNTFASGCKINSTTLRNLKPKRNSETKKINYKIQFNTNFHDNVMHGEFSFFLADLLLTHIAI